MALEISAPAQYALRTLVHLARREANSRARVREVADAEDIPYAFLAKLVGQLVQAGFLDSFKGPAGGISLARPPHRITVLEILECVEGDGVFQQCFLGLPECSETAPCPAHKAWAAVRAQLLERLCNATIAELSATVDERKKRR